MKRRAFYFRGDDEKEGSFPISVEKLLKIQDNEYSQSKMNGNNNIGAASDVESKDAFNKTPFVLFL